MRYATYEYYKTQYCGTMSESDFLRLSTQASAYLDQATRDRIAEGWELTRHADRIRMACCAVADVYRLNEQGGGIVSESNDGISVDYALGVSNVKTADQRLHDAAAMFISRTGLMYQGV